ncbi:MAG: hypothetical protein NTW95_08680 [Candidatus Aminicenantes bacterium]|nr:hypothetical protein [Candidatus Aminicenantes bacterium]
MKKIAKPFLFGVILLACLFVINTGCKKKAECSGATQLCTGHTFEACCTETDCYYVVDGDEQFDCNGTDCYAAASDMVYAYCGYNVNEKEALKTIEKLLAAIK